MNEKQRIPGLVAALEAARGKQGSIKMLVGFDGFFDEIVHVVDQRQDAKNYTRMEQSSTFASRIARASGLSTNIELVSVINKLGGNAPILANGLLEYGVDVTFVGAIGERDVHPAFASLAERAKVYPICQVAHTYALEFDDAKIMISKNTFDPLTWSFIKTRLGGLQAVTDIIKECALLGICNWTMTPYMSGIWEGMIEEVFPLLPDRGVKPLAFFDLCDPEKRTGEDIKYALELLRKFERKFRTILGLNKKEAFDIAKLYGIHTNNSMSEAEQLKKVTTELYEKLQLHGIVVHPTKEAASCVKGEYFHTDGPFTPKPVLTTGAGDNFNGGFCLGQALGLPERDSLLLAVATSGFYVRNAKSPTYDDIIGFLNIWGSEL